jgi:hypothetical protein
VRNFCIHVFPATGLKYFILEVAANVSQSVSVKRFRSSVDSINTEAEIFLISQMSKIDLQQLHSVKVGNRGARIYTAKCFHWQSRT